MCVEEEKRGLEEVSIREEVGSVHQEAHRRRCSRRWQRGER